MSFKIFSNEFRWVYNQTNGLIQATLILNVLIIIILSIIIFSFFKLKLDDFFIDRKAFLNGLKAIFILWTLVQIVIVLISFVNNETLSWVTANNRKTGNFIGQLFGNALYEEFIFRGFFIIQLFLLFRPKKSNRKALLFSIIISQLIFAAVHIPNRLMADIEIDMVTDFLQLFLGGLVGAFIFVKTKNLIFLSGFHAFTNVPFNILSYSGSSEIITLIIGILISIFWNKINLTGYFRNKSTIIVEKDYNHI